MTLWPNIVETESRSGGSTLAGESEIEICLFSTNQYFVLKHHTVYTQRTDSVSFSYLKTETSISGCMSARYICVGLDNFVFPILSLTL